LPALLATVAGLALLGSMAAAMGSALTAEKDASPPPALAVPFRHHLMGVGSSGASASGLSSLPLNAAAALMGIAGSARRSLRRRFQPDWGS
jgi:hypothetical protein